MNNVIKAIVATATLIMVVDLIAPLPSLANGKELRTKYNHILNIASTPEKDSDSHGLFTDAGSWMGFTIPDSTKPINGFCGPFDIDTRTWLTQTFCNVGATLKGKAINATSFKQQRSSYAPGMLTLISSYNNLTIEQTLQLIDKNHALLSLTANEAIRWHLSSTIWANGNAVAKENSIIITLADGQLLTVTFPPKFQLDLKDSTYMATSVAPSKSEYVVVGFFENKQQQQQAATKAAQVLKAPQSYANQSAERWNSYLKNGLRPNMPENYNRSAVKSIVTLVANWRAPKGDLYHDGVIPSHAVSYFNGFWAWDSWKHAVALAKIDPELAKNQVRAMFDYQQPDGMVIDCIYSNKKENNARDSKPPLATWAVYEIYRQTNDKAFVREMFPKLVKYHQWWFKYRDHDKNSICEFGSVDGTTEAAKWESGMDNAVRYDDATMVQNSEHAWSFDQESVELNAYLCLEARLLGELAATAGEEFSSPIDPQQVNAAFFDSTSGYYFDRSLNGNLINVEGPEGWIPLWTEIAPAQNAAAVMKVMANPKKFATYIPFPTLAADNPKFNPKGYWRGPIWLDQVYFGISGIRKYGYQREADTFTDNVFTRLKGLSGNEPIHENYGTHTGERLKAPHFSWSAAHLLMLYWEYGKQ